MEWVRVAEGSEHRLDSTEKEPGQARPGRKDGPSRHQTEVKYSVLVVSGLVCLHIYLPLCLNLSDWSSACRYSRVKLVLNITKT